jgi:hypothetical protein
MVNVERGDMNGAQIGLVNVDKPTRESRSAQVGLANVTGGTGERTASSVGLVNVAKKQRGVQIGLVNYADEVEGVQIGLVSVARKNSGASLSLIPIVLDGDNRATLGWTETSVLNVGLKLGTRRFYVKLDWGFTRDTNDHGHREFTSTIGLGVHLIPRGGRFLLDLDASTTGFAAISSSGSKSNWELSSTENEDRLVHSLRLRAGFAVARHLMIFAGPSLNVQNASGSDARQPRTFSFAEATWTSGNTTVRMYPGFTAGLEF